MSRIGELCDQLMRELRELGSVTPDSILPGLTKEEIFEKTKHLPFQLPNSVLDLYQWGNGYRCKDGDPNFITYYYFLSLEEALETYAALSADDEFPRFHSGSMRWFPLMNTCGGGVDYLGIVCSDEPSADSQIVDDDNSGEHRDNETLPIVKYQSLEKLLETYIEALRRGASILDDNGGLVNETVEINEQSHYVGRNDRAFRAIARAHNPGLDCWDDPPPPPPPEPEVFKPVRIYPFAEWRALIKTALSETLALHKVALRTLSAHYKIDALDFSLYLNSAAPTLSFHFDDKHDARDVDKDNWLLWAPLYHANCPAFKRLYEELKQSVNSMPYELHLGSQIDHVMNYAAAEALLDPEIIAQLNEYGIHAYLPNERVEWSFRYFINRWSSSYNACDAVISRRVMDYQTNPNYVSLAPVVPPRRWNRPAMEDMQGILCHRPPMYKEVDTLHAVVYQNVRQANPPLTRWFAFPSTDERRRQRLFCEAANWRSWRTQEELAALVTRPGKYILRLSSTGSMVYYRTCYLNEDGPNEVYPVWGSPKKGYPWSCGNLKKARLFDSSEDLIGMVNRLQGLLQEANSEFFDDHVAYTHYWEPVLYEEALEMHDAWDELEKEDPWVVDLVKEKIKERGAAVTSNNDDECDDDDECCDGEECEFDESKDDE